MWVPIQLVERRRQLPLDHVNVKQLVMHKTKACCCILVFQLHCCHILLIYERAKKVFMLVDGGECASSASDYKLKMLVVAWKGGDTIVGNSIPILSNLFLEKGILHVMKLQRVCYEILHLKMWLECMLWLFSFNLHYCNYSHNYWLMEKNNKYFKFLQYSSRCCNFSCFISVYYQFREPIE